MDLQNHSTASRLLMAGVVLTFIIVLGLSWFLFRKVVPGATNNNQPIEVIPERTPAEIISSYQSELAAVAVDMESNMESNITAAKASKILNDFFFLVRVPETARDAHLKAALEFTNTDPKKSDEEKITAWKEIIKKLQTTVTAL